MRRRKSPSDQVGATVLVCQSPVQPKSPVYDWFDFLKASANPFLSAWYSLAMLKKPMEESVLLGITHDALRTLALEDGDALKMMN